MATALTATCSWTECGSFDPARASYERVNPPMHLAARVAGRRQSGYREGIGKGRARTPLTTRFRDAGLTDTTRERKTSWRPVQPFVCLRRRGALSPSSRMTICAGRPRGRSGTLNLCMSSDPSSPTLSRIAIISSLMTSLTRTVLISRASAAIGSWTPACRRSYARCLQAGLQNTGGRPRLAGLKVQRQNAQGTDFWRGFLGVVFCDENSDEMRSVKGQLTLIHGDSHWRLHQPFGQSHHWPVDIV